MAVKKRVHGGILTAMNHVVLPRVEMSLRSITDSPGRGSYRMAQNSDQRDFSGNTSRIAWNTDQDRNDEDRSFENIEEGDFLALGPNYDRQAQPHPSETLGLITLWCVVSGCLDFQVINLISILSQVYKRWFDDEC